MSRIPLLHRLLLLAVLGILGCTETSVEPEAGSTPSFSRTAPTVLSTTGIAVLDLGPGLAYAINEPAAAALGYQGQVSVWRGGTFNDLMGPPASPEAINNRGLVVGRSFEERALLWDHGMAVDLGTLGGANAWAYDINDRRQVVGWSTNTGSYHRAFLWQKGEMQDLGTLGGYQSWAYGINDRGEVVGEAWTEVGSGHAFVWRAGVMQDLGTLDGPTSRAEAINNRGDVVGSCSTGQPERTHACLWSQHEILDLGTLGGDPSYAYDISENGLVVGISSVVGGPGPIDYHGFMWKAGQMTDLGTLGGCCSYALGVNNRGQVVGYAFDASWVIHAVIWGP